MTTQPWYQGVTRYQWTVLVIASLGWVFDAFEGQLYNITRAEMLPDLLRCKPGDPLVRAWGDRLLGVFLLGGTLGGWLFSSLADRWGRRPVMALTILFYSIFSGMTAFAADITQVGLLRFLVAMGVGGEWAVGGGIGGRSFPGTGTRASGRNFSCIKRGGVVACSGGGADDRNGMASRILARNYSGDSVHLGKDGNRRARNVAGSAADSQRRARKFPGIAEGSRTEIAGGGWSLAGDDWTGHILGRGDCRSGPDKGAAAAAV